MLFRCALGVLVLLGTACLSAPPPDTGTSPAANSVEVYRVFCMRAARSAYPTELTGLRFHPLCDGETPDTDEPDPTLHALLRNRPRILDALAQTLGERDVGAKFPDGEITAFLKALLPLYGETDDPGLIPHTTRNLANFLARARDGSDPRASAALDTIARVSARTGYRPRALVLGASRALLQYPKLDQLAGTLLSVIGEGGTARDAWLELLRASALELADDVVKSPDPNDTTLHVALALLLATHDELAGSSGALPVLQRDQNGAALGSGPTPFAVADDDGVERDANGVALVNGQPAYQTFDANRTVLAGVMRVAALLFERGQDPRAPIENLAHGLRALLGPWQAQSFTIGKAQVAFQGPDLAQAPLLDLVHALAALARYPETDAVLDALNQLLAANESETSALIYGGLQIDARSDDFPAAKLNGPHEFWDDLIAVATRMLQRPGMVEAVIHSFTDPKSASLGKILGVWMHQRDQVTYRNAPIVIDPPAPYTDQQKADINAPVEHAYSEAVDRTSQDSAWNRSIFERTLSMIDGLNRTRICNKDNAVLTTPTAIGDLTFPVGGGSYEACDLIEIPDAIEIYLRAALGTGKINIKDAMVTVLASLGQAIGITGSIGDVQEQASQITGFRDSISAPAAARFLFAPRNKFLSDLFDPAPHRQGGAIAVYETYGLFPMENKDPVADGESFLSAGIPLMKAFDEHELRDANGVLTDHYLFGDLLSAMHTHWPSKHDQPCAAIAPGDEGCVQSVDATAPFYVPGTNVVSYEELLTQSFLDEDYVGILQRAAAKLSAIKVGDKDGVTVLSDFATRLLTADPALKTRAGIGYTKTNTCVEVAGPACQGTGHIIPQLTPLYLLLDALKEFDESWDADAQRSDAWHAGRSKLVDVLLTVDRSGALGAYQYKLTSRDAYGVVLGALPWLRDQMKRHRDAGDLDAWSAGLSDRLAKVLSHPMAAGALDLLDALWNEPAAGGDFVALVSSLLSEAGDPDAYRGTLESVSDTLVLLDRDPNFSPAVQLASLALAPNAFAALEGDGQPDVAGGAADSTLAFARAAVAAAKPVGEPTVLSKLLRNLVLGTGDASSPVEVLFDAVANVNRSQKELPDTQSLSADEDRAVFGVVQQFLADDSPNNRSLERLYAVIHHRSLP